MTGSAAIPSDIRLNRGSRTLELTWPDGARHVLSCEFLRVYSPSAEVRGHGPGQEVLQTGKRMVTIESVEAVGHYALQFRFSDGHDSGIYAWDYLRALCRDHDRLWEDYLRKLALAGASRDPAGPVLIARQS